MTRVRGSFVTCAGDVSSEPRWHVISSVLLMELLERAHAGEDPEWVYIEAYANAQHPEDEYDD